jgi:hypothetical protein
MCISGSNDARKAFAEVLRISVSAGSRCKREKGSISGRDNPKYCCIYGAESCQQLHCAVAPQRLNECHPRHFLFMRYSAKQTEARHGMLFHFLISALLRITCIQSHTKRWKLE